MVGFLRIFFAWYIFAVVRLFSGTWLCGAILLETFPRVPFCVVRFCADAVFAGTVLYGTFLCWGVFCVVHVQFLRRAFLRL